MMGIVCVQLCEMYPATVKAVQRRQSIKYVAIQEYDIVQHFNYV
jgi:hypothetical protein